MSSLLQFGGETGKKGVRLEFCQKLQEADALRYPEGWYSELVTCQQCSKRHARIYVAWRKPLGMFGHWVVFRYNGEEHVPDLSIVIDVLKLPRDAKPLSDEENSVAWHRT